MQQLDGDSVQQRVTVLCGLLLVSAALGNLLLAGEAGAETITSWSDGLVWKRFDFRNSGSTTVTLNLTKYQNVTSAIVKVTAYPYTDAEGVLYKPLNPALDIGADGDDWKFDGTMGYQNSFLTSEGSAETKSITFAGAETQTVSLRLPKSPEPTQFSAATFNLSSADPGRFSYAASIGSTTIWSRSSYSLAFSQSVLTVASLALNGVVVSDFDHDGFKDAVAVGGGGSAYLIRGVGPGQLDTTAVRLQTNTDNEILSVAAGDIDQNNYDDLVLGTRPPQGAEAQLIVLRNQASGFGGVFATPGAGSALTSLAVTDLDGDSLPEVVAGAMGATNLYGMYLYINNNTNLEDTEPPVPPFKPPVFLKAGNGAMNAIALGTFTSLDGPIDGIVGASNDRSAWFAKLPPPPSQNWRGDSFTFFPLRTGLNELKSVAVGDIDGDGYADIVGGNNDGKVYVSQNTGTPEEPFKANSQAKGYAMKNPAKSITAVLVNDIDKDNDRDILAVGKNLTGVMNMYYLLREGDTTQEGQVMAKVSAGISYMIGTDLDMDGDTDIAAADGAKVTTYLNGLGAFSSSTDNISVPLQEYLSKAVPENDAFGNPMVSVPVTIASSYAGQLGLSNLTINFTHTAYGNVTRVLRDYINSRRSTAPPDGTISVPFKFSLGSPGSIVASLLINYVTDPHLVIDPGLCNSTVYTNQSLNLKAWSDPGDPDGKLYNYTWEKTNPPRAGPWFGGTTTLAPAEVQKRLSTGLNMIKVTLRVNGTEQDSISCPIRVEIPKMPVIEVSAMDRPAEAYIGEVVSIKVTIVNRGDKEAGDVTIVLNDTATGQIIGALPVDRIPVNKTATVTFTWTPTTGKHGLRPEIICTESSPCVVSPKPSPVWSATPKEKGADMTMMIFLILFIAIVAGVGGGVAYGFKSGRLGGKKGPTPEEVKAEEERKRAATDYSSLYGTAPQAPPPGGYDPYSSYGSREAYTSYYGGTGYETYSSYGTPAGGPPPAPAPSQELNFTCPKCQKPTAKEGKPCSDCECKAAIDEARKKIKVYKEEGIEMEEAEKALSEATSMQAKKQYAEALEAVNRSRKSADALKKRYDAAFASLSGAPPPPPAPKPAIVPAVKKPGPAIPPASPPKPVAPALKPAAPPSPPLQPARASPGTCPGCGKKIDPKWKLCPFCHRKL